MSAQGRTTGIHGLSLVAHLQLLLRLGKRLVRRRQIALVLVAALDKTDKAFLIKSESEGEDAPCTLSILPSQTFSLTPFGLSVTEVCPFELGWGEGDVSVKQASIWRLYSSEVEGGKLEPAFRTGACVLLPSHQFHNDQSHRLAAEAPCPARSSERHAWHDLTPGRA